MTVYFQFFGGNCHQAVCNNDAVELILTAFSIFDKEGEFFIEGLVFTINENIGDITYSSVNELKKQSTVQTEEQYDWDAAIETDSSISDDVGDLDMTCWSNDCESIYFIYFAVKDSQGAQFYFSDYMVDTYLRKVDKRTFAAYFRFPITMPDPDNRKDYANCAENIPVAKIVRLEDNKLEFTWLGFYDTKKKMRVHTQNPFKSDQQSVILQMCRRD